MRRAAHQAAVDLFRTERGRRAIDGGQQSVERRGVPVIAPFRLRRSRDGSEVGDGLVESPAGIERGTGIAVLFRDMKGKQGAAASKRRRRVERHLRTCS